MAEPGIVNVGMVGLGAMGSAMSGSLLRAGHAVVGYDIDDRRMAEHSGDRASSPAAVADRADVVILSLPSTAALADVVDGLLASRRRGFVAVDTSTLPLDAKLAAQRSLAAAGVSLLDCPVSGTSGQARTRDIVVYVSGDDPDAKRRAGPVLDALARARHDVGAFGNGSRLKYVANLLVAIHTAAAAEALLLAERAGLDPGHVLPLLADGAGNSRMLQVRGPLMVAGAYDEAHMRVELFRKDIEIIEAYAGEVGSPTPLFSAAAALYRTAQEHGRGGQDTASVFAELSLPPGGDASSPAR